VVISFCNYPILYISPKPPLWRVFLSTAGQPSHIAEYSHPEWFLSCRNVYFKTNKFLFCHLGRIRHLLGAALATILLGPWCSSIIISTVLIIQCLFFQDGGLTALGGNILNMAVAGTLVALGVYRLVTKLVPGKKGEMVGTFMASWASVVAAAFTATVELAVSGTVPFNFALAAMLGWHVIIGIGEGLITAVAVSFVRGLGFSTISKQGKVEDDV